MNMKSKYIYVVSPGALSETSFFTFCEPTQLLEREDRMPSEGAQDEERADAAVVDEAFQPGSSRLGRIFFRLAKYLPTPVGNVA